MSQPAAPTTETPTTPTPNSMPGAAPVADKAPAAAPTDATKAADTTSATEATGLTADERSELERLRAVRTEERIWEKRAKDNFDAAKKWADHEESQKTEDQKRQDRDAAMLLENQSLKEQVAREKVARETGVPPELIGGSTEEAMRSSAEVALAYKGSGTPALPNSSAAPASSVTSTDKVSGPTQITSRDELAQMSPQARMQAWRDGRLKDLGAGAPPVRPSVKVNT